MQRLTSERPNSMVRCVQRSTITIGSPLKSGMPIDLVQANTLMSLIIIALVDEIGQLLLDGHVVQGSAHGEGHELGSSIPARLSVQYL